MDLQEVGNFSVSPIKVIEKVGCRGIQVSPAISLGLGHSVEGLLADCGSEVGGPGQAPKPTSKGTSIVGRRVRKTKELAVIGLHQRPNVLENNFEESNPICSDGHVVGFERILLEEKVVKKGRLGRGKKIKKLLPREKATCGKKKLEKQKLAKS